MGAAAQGQGGNPRRGMDAKVTGLSRAVHSMTGVARRDGGDAAVSWTWEIKSVNGRSLDVPARLPQGYESLDPAVRSAVAADWSRGNVQVHLAMKRGSAPLQLQVNEARQEERRVGTECVGTCRCRRVTDHLKKQTRQNHKT